MGAGHLKIGDTIKQADGTVGVIANVVTIQQTQEMFNLTVSEAHTYYVGEQGWLVHNANPPRYDGPKPSYYVNPVHDPSSPQYQPSRKTDLPADAQRAYRTAVPDSPTSPRHWYSVSENGQIYRFSSGNDGTVHYSGTFNDANENKTIAQNKYLKDRLKALGACL